MEGLTKKMSQNLVSDTDAPEQQPFKLSQNLHQKNFMNLKAAGLRQKFPKRKEKLLMFGKMQEDLIQRYMLSSQDPLCKYLFPSNNLNQN